MAIHSAAGTRREPGPRAEPPGPRAEPFQPRAEPPGPRPEPPGARGLALSPTAQDLLFRTARTPNTFAPEPVSDDQVRAIHDLVKYAPTSMNQQPLRVVLARSPSARAALERRMYGGNRAKVASAPLVALLAADLEFHRRLPRLFPHAPGAAELYADSGVRRESAVFNAALQVGYFILGVRAAGLAAGPIAGFDVAGVTKEFFGDGRHEVLAVVNIGRPGPDAWFPRLPRLEFDEVVSVV
ncbi:malonic semialdehyde reductase [Streptomyces sp. URMC 123]|uniref:malonic semialdehyde reductase n=1 Tax=Streptomyces sp. URMC 123 TaxID=3423403 RepID=UPI003F1B2EB5